MITRGHLGEQVLAEDRAHVDRRGGQRDPQAAAAESPVDPIDRVGHLLAEPIVDALGDRLQPVGRGGEILPLLRAVRSAWRRCRSVATSFRRRSPSGLATMPGWRTRPLPFGCSASQPATLSKKSAARSRHSHTSFWASRQLVMHQQPAVGPVVVELAQRVFDLAVGDAQAQVVAGHGFDACGLRRRSPRRTSAECSRSRAAAPGR